MTAKAGVEEAAGPPQAVDYPARFARMAMPTSLLLALATSAGACSLPPREIERLASLPYSTFDREPAPHGWRDLSRRGCAESAVALLHAYGSANSSRLGAMQNMELAFHAGQVLALAGRDTESIAHFERSLGPTATPEWRTYVEATLAFLRKDQAALQAARDRYASVAPTSVRLRFIDGFLACPDEPYAKAVHCRL